MSRLDWPILNSYDADHLQRISLPLGGIGTGNIGLGGRGDLRDFEVGNRPGKGFRPDVAFVAVTARSGDGPERALLAEGPLPIEAYEGAFGSPAPNQGLPRFADCTFHAAYPLGQVRLHDDDFPLDVTIEGFNPFVLCDTETSSLPVAVLRYRLTNTSDTPVRSTVALSMSNFVGANGTEDATGDNRNSYRETDTPQGRLHGVTMTAPGLAPDAEAAGEFTIAMLTSVPAEPSHRTQWAKRNWGGGLLDYWQDLLDDGLPSERESDMDRPVASLAARMEIPAGETVTATYLITWNFPNHRAWAASGSHLADQGSTVIGNAYSRADPDSWSTAQTIARDLDRLENATIQTVAAIVDTDAPVALKEAALFNLSTLRSTTVFQSAAGDYYGWEGVGDRVGSCHGTCTHVWGYEFATSLLFAPIAESFRMTQYERSTDERGLMSFRTGLPIEEAQSWRLAAADGQMACLVHLYLDWKLSGDQEFLHRMWPAARRSLEFCWIPGGWDADQDGVMEGVQHNTMDVEYYGPNPQMGSWYLAALRAMEELSHAVGEPEFAERCRGLFASGSQWLDENLFNGSYYRHEVRPVPDPNKIADGLRHQSMGALDTENPDFQLADGCLIDQLVGQYAATLTGLGPILDLDHVRTTWRSVYERNMLHGFGQHFNPMRGFVLGDETAVLMCTYDDGKAPTRPFPYFGEVMTGFEHTAATGLLQTGAVSEAVEIVTAVRDRYDGARRNPFDEAECGHHYARAMAAWSTFATWNGISYSGLEKTMIIADRASEGMGFWSTGRAFGTWNPGDDDDIGTLHVIGGELPISELVVSSDRYQSPSPTLTPGTKWAVSRGTLSR